MSCCGSPRGAGGGGGRPRGGGAGAGAGRGGRAWRAPPPPPAALEALRADGVRVVMLTGDNRTTAEAIARRLGITEIEAEVLPDQKSAVVDKLKREGRIGAMAGD